MKKVTAILLSTVLLLTAIFVAIPVSAVADTPASAPIQATPLTIGNTFVNDNVKATDVSLLAFVKTSGSHITLNSNKDFYGVNGEGRGTNGFRFDMESSSQLNKGDAGLMFRYESNGKSTFSPMAVVSGSWYNLKSGATVMVLKDGATEWETISTTATTKPQIEFSEAFSGFVKISYRDFDNYGIPSDKDRPISRIDIYTYGMGTVGDNTFASDIVVGPFFTVTSDSSSTKIVVPDEYKPDAINARPLVITNATSNLDATISDVNPLLYTTVGGKNITLNAGGGFEGADGEGRGAKYVSFTPATGTTINSSESHILFYFKTEGKVAVNLRLRTSNTWAPLNGSKTIQVLSDGSSKWENKNVKDTVTGSATWSEIEFDGAFSGYIKVSYVDLVMYYSAGVTTLNFIDIYCHGMGKVGDNTYTDSMTFGPFFTVTSDSSSNLISVPDEFKTKSVEAKPLPLQNVSGNGLDYVTSEDVCPLDYTGATGKCFKLQAGKSFNGADYAGRGSTYFSFAPSIPTKINNSETHILFYFSTSDKVKVNIRLRTSNTWAPLNGTKTIKVLRDGKSEWEDKSVNDTVTGSETWSEIEFDEAFSGLIKISYVDLVMYYSNGETTLNYIDIYCHGMGTSGVNTYTNEMTVGPFFSVSADSKLSDDIEIISTNGDVNADGLKDAKDLSVLRKYLLTENDSKYSEKYGDYNEDGSIDLIDLVKLNSDIAQ